MEKQIPEKSDGAMYDVFISCKSEDYHLAAEIYDYLNDNGIKVFLSTKELRLLREAEYTDAISEALDSCYHLLVISTSRDNVMSKWVKFEWITFLNEMLSGRKQGQIMTLLQGMDVESLPIQLRHYESFTSDDYKGRLLHYVETPNSIRRKEIARKKSVEEERLKLAKKEEESRIESLKSEIIEKETDYRRYASALDELSNQIICRRKELGESTKQCPVCGSNNSIESRFCSRCGWTYLPPFEIMPSADKDHLFIMQSLWNSQLLHSAVVKEVSDLKENLSSMAETVSSLTQTTDDYRNQIVQLTAENEKLSNASGQAVNLSIVRKSMVMAALCLCVLLLGSILITRSVCIRNIQDLSVHSDHTFNNNRISEYDSLSSSINGYEYVNLALPSGLLWATCNIGASRPEEFGDYIAWGETCTHNTYDWSALKSWISGDSYKNVIFSEYVTDSEYGVVDGKNILDFDDDAARVNWGANWRIPTRIEWMELKNNCTWTWTNKYGCNGYIVSSKSNSKCIFLPAAGSCGGENQSSSGSYGDYWSSSLDPVHSYSACRCYFASGTVDCSGWGYRRYGFSVRPVASSTIK